MPSFRDARLLVLFVALASALSVACGEGHNTITGPSNRIPSVAGNYSGTTSITFPELGQFVTCPTTTSVTQSGSTVTIAPLELRGECGTVSIPVGAITIDGTGSLGSDTGTTTSESCGTYTYTGSGGFSGRELRISFVYTSKSCHNMNMTINLTRS